MVGPRQVLLMILPVCATVQLLIGLWLYVHHDHLVLFALLIVVAGVQLMVAPAYLRRNWNR